MKTSKEIKEKFFSKIILFQKKFNYLCRQSIEHNMQQEKINLTYPKKFICVMSSSSPEFLLDFNEQSQYIAEKLNRTPFERMTNLLEERTIEESRKNFNK